MLFLILLIALGLILIFIVSLVIAVLRVFPKTMGPPFVASGDIKLKAMLELANIMKGQKVADLGSGNGKVVIAFAKQGAQAYGYEINPFLVFLSKYRIKKLGLQKKACVYCKNLWNVDLKEFDVIVIYGIPYMMKQLEEKIQKEATAGTKIISNNFTFPNWKIKRQLDVVKLYIKE